MRMGQTVSKLAFVSFLSFSFFLTRMSMALNTTASINVSVGVVMDLETLHGKMGLSCISMALSNFYASVGHDYKTRLLLRVRDSRSDVVGATAAALDLIKTEEVQAIIGPESSSQASFVRNVGEKTQVPIVTYSATSPFLTSPRNKYFIRAAQTDSSQVMPISAVVQAFEWREVVPIYVDNDFGEGIITSLMYALQEAGIRVPHLSVIHPDSSDADIIVELHKLVAMQTRVFIVHMLPSLGSRIFTKAKEMGMLKEGYVWIVTDGITNQLSSLDSTVIGSMQGVLGVKTYVPRTKKVEDFSVQWKRKFQQENPAIIDAGLDIFGFWAHDAAIALAMAVEKAGTTNLVFRKKNVSGSLDLGVSANGPKLVEALSSLNFKGLAGDFHLVNGQLQSPVFQIVNVNGNGWKGVGFWTSASGIVRELGLLYRSTFSTSKANLGSIIWPGDSTSVPKSWEVPVHKKLRIGVPRKDNFIDFVNLSQDPITNTTNALGYCIDVFHAAIKKLPYTFTYEFVLFEGSYDDLIYNLFLKNFDAVVGDVSISPERALHVDFTLPYTENTLTMIVSAVKDAKEQSAWGFLKPLTWDLWLTSACFFAFIGFVVWVLEHRINQDFRGPPSYQLGTCFWFSLSTVVFAQRERLVSNLGRFVVIIWCFVVLILTQSYTASWTSLLTVGQLQPPITDINELVIRGEYVGYQRDSFVSEILKGLGFHESKLRPYTSPEEFDQLFSKGSEDGGIVAAFDEAPYMKVIAAKYCSKYTMIQQMSLTNGFGFAFQKGSQLVLDFSSAIMNLTGDGKIIEIEKKWFGGTNCSRRSTSDPPLSLGLASFWGLFLIAGVAALAALFIHTAMFIYEHRRVFVRSDAHPESSIWSRLVFLLRNFDKRDLRCCTLGEENVVQLRDRHLVTSSTDSYVVSFGEDGGSEISSSVYLS